LIDHREGGVHTIRGKDIVFTKSAMTVMTLIPSTFPIDNRF